MVSSNDNQTYDGLVRNSDGTYNTMHHPEGIPEDDIFFHEDVVSKLVLQWRETGDIEVWKQIVNETIPLINTIILDNGFVDYEDINCLRSECVLKLFKLIDKFDPSRGRAFTIFSISILNHLRSFAGKSRSVANRNTFVDENVLENFEGRTYVNYNISEEFRERVMCIDTRFLKENQKSAVQYYITYFINDGFHTSKSKMIATASKSFGLSIEQSSILYDYALIKLRSELYDLNDVPLTDIELLRISKKWSVIPEMAELIGMPSMKKLISIFGGINITLPSAKDLQKLKQSQVVLKTVKEDYSHYKMVEISDEYKMNAEEELERLSRSINNRDCYSEPLFEDESDIY